MNPQTRKRQNLTAVYAALLQLMSQKPLSRISITELCQHAQVSRTYFYRNFANFDQIILAYQKQTILQYLRQLPRQSKVKLQVLMTQYFTLMQQMAATNALLIKNEKPRFLFKVSKPSLHYSLNKTVLSVQAIPRFANRTTRLIFLVRSSICSFIGNRMGWLKHRPISLNRSLGSLYAITKVGPK